MIFWKISGIILMAGMIITLTIDLAMNQAITWSKYPVTISGVLLVNTTLIAFWCNKSLLLFSFSFIASSILIILLDIYAGKSLQFGWSLIVVASVVIISALLLYIHFRLKKITDLKRFFHI